MFESCWARQEKMKRLGRLRLGRFRFRSRLNREGPYRAPSGAAKIEEREVLLVVRDHVCVHPECESRVGVTQLVGDPSHRLPRGERQTRVRVPRAVESKRTDASA
jgi:hypothetical protein